MVVNETRKRLLRQLNSRYIWGKYPLLHAIIFAIQITMVTILIRKFNAYYANRPVLTTMITNAVLGGIADTIAQTLTALRLRQRQITLNPSASPREDFFSMEIQELDRKVPWPENDFMIPASKRGPLPFDFERLTRFMAYGFLWTPVQHKWYAFLGSTFPFEGGRGGAGANTFKRVAMDQFLMAPIALASFFSFMTVAEGGGKRAVAQKFQEVYIPALKANYMVWPAVQLFNFRVVPMPFQIPFVSTIGIAWTAYLSMRNSEDEPTTTPLTSSP